MHGQQNIKKVLIGSMLLTNLTQENMTTNLNLHEA